MTRTDTRRLLPKSDNNKPPTSALSESYKDLDEYAYFTTLISFVHFASGIYSAVCCISIATNITSTHDHYRDWVAVLACLFATMGLLRVVLVIGMITFWIKGNRVPLSLQQVADFVTMTPQFFAGFILLALSSARGLGYGARGKHVSEVWAFMAILIQILIIMLHCGIQIVRPKHFIEYSSLLKAGQIRRSPGANGDGVEMRPIKKPELKSRSDVATMTPMPRTVSRETSPPIFELCVNEKCRKDSVVGKPGIRISETDLDTAKKNLRRTSVASIDSVFGFAHVHLPKMLPIVVEDIFDEVSNINLEATIDDKPLGSFQGSYVNFQEDSPFIESAIKVNDINNNQPFIREPLVSQPDTMKTPTIPPPPIPDVTPGFATSPTSKDGAGDAFPASPRYANVMMMDHEGRVSTTSGDSKHSERFIY